MNDRPRAPHHVRIEREYVHEITRLSKDRFRVVLQDLDGSEDAREFRIKVGDALRLRHRFVGEMGSFAEPPPHGDGQRKTNRTGTDSHHLHGEKLMRDFAKIFDTDKGQVLVHVGADDDGEPSLRVVVCPESWGTPCATCVVFSNPKGVEDYDSWGEAFKAFDCVTQESAERAAEVVYETLRELGADI